MTVMVGQRGGGWAMRFGGPNVDWRCCRTDLQSCLGDQSDRHEPLSCTLITYRSNLHMKRVIIVSLLLIGIAGCQPDTACLGQQNGCRATRGSNRRPPGSKSQ